MKKMIATAILFIMMIMFVTTIKVSAATSSTLADELYNLGAKYGVSSSDKIKIKRYLVDNPVTDEQANEIMAKANEAVKIMEEANATNVNQLTKEQKNKLKTIANEAASIVGLTLTYKNGTVEIYKNGKRIEVVTFSNGKLAYTGNDGQSTIAITSVVVIALATSFIVRKKFANV